MVINHAVRAFSEKSTLSAYVMNVRGVLDYSQRHSHIIGRVKQKGTEGMLAGQKPNYPPTPSGLKTVSEFAYCFGPMKYQLPFGLSLSKVLHPFTFRQAQCERTSNIIGPKQ